MAKSKLQSQIQRAKKAGLSNVEFARIQENARKTAERVTQEMEQRAVEKAMLLFLKVGCEILAHDYWEKSAKKRIPEFCSKFFGLLDAYMNDVVDYGQIMEDLKETTGYDFDSEWIKNVKKEGE